MKRQKAYDKRRQKNFGEPTEDGEADQATPGAAAKSESNTPSGGAAATTTADADSPGSGRPGFLAPAGETYQIVDGEIVLDSRSLQVDRHARAAAEAGELEEQEENDFTNHTTSATYLRRNLKPQQWADDETEKFFHALSMFGTDFDTISRMFKTKTRKHVKLKFNREERANPDRIQAALVGEKTVNMSLDEYKRHTGKEYETTEAIDAELKKAETEFEARQKAIEDEKVEEQRRKREALFSGGNKNDGDGEGEGGGGGKKRKRGRGRKAKMGGACL
ncbi:hypothetical protein B0T17DRAFT_493738 [Bombardia bombarda]|uniref:Myb-like domain-containing protein n=1 Tax=Bombardia bombarda TaxID=252184 RepID=A0AA39WTX4_9PEZI|nr:hypothetical protein B0T17DRAFT_493738 [Bombardia bombarda]